LRKAQTFPSAPSDISKESLKSAKFTLLFFAGGFLPLFYNSNRASDEVQGSIFFSFFALSPCFVSLHYRRDTKTVKYVKKKKHEKMKI
jgi:hypothetical protein